MMIDSAGQTATTRASDILVVDDERDVRDGFERILTRMGHRVFKAEQGEEALSFFEERTAEIVLLDLKMPGMDGLEVLDRILAAHPEVLVIIITGFATIETAIEAMKKGAYHFMTKPFRPEQLRIVINRAIEHIVLKEERDRLSAERDRGLWAITQEKSRLRTVVDSIVAGILIIEIDKRIVMCNPAFLKITRIDPAGLIGSYVNEHSTLKAVDGIIDDILAGRANPDGDLTCEFEIAGGKPTYIRATVNTVASETGDVIGLVSVLRDVTSAKEQEKERSAYMAMLTHELRAPLSTVDTQFHVVLRGLAGELTEKQRDLFGKMHAVVRSVIEMINSLLDLSRIEARQFVQEKTCICLNPVLEDTAELLIPQAAAKRQSFILDLSLDLPPMMGDPNSLKEVASNLISNAIRFTPEGGSIRVCTSCEGNRIRLDVIDNGIGIAAEHLQKIFDRFYRVKNRQTMHIPGTGLGLPIVKAIVDDHDGTISVKSEPDHGTTFSVYFPLPA